MSTFKIDICINVYKLHTFHLYMIQEMNKTQKYDHDFIKK